MGKYSEYSDILRPLECPLCGRTHPLRKHGTCPRYVCDLFLVPVIIKLLRYYCPGCGHTVSILPSFCIPRKQYSAGVISLCLQLILACAVSLRQVNRAYPLISRVLAGVWLKQWSFSGNGVLSVLRNSFGFKPQSADMRAGHNSRYITPGSLEAFFISCDFACEDEINICHGECDISNTVKCERRMCAGILKSLQEKFAALPFPVRLF